MIAPPPVIINGSECYVNWTCLSVSGAQYTPSSLSYEVWNITNPSSPVSVVGATSLTPSPTGTITLTATVNTMTEPNTEYRQVTVRTGIPGGTFINNVSNYVLIEAAGTP